MRLIKVVAFRQGEPRRDILIDVEPIVAEICAIELSGNTATVNFISSIGNVVGGAMPNNIMCYQGGQWVPVPLPTPSVPSSTINNLSSIGDVVGNATAGSFLSYTDGQWVPAAGPGALSSTIENISSIGDVIGGASSGDILAFDGSSWAPAAIVFPSAVVESLSSIGDVNIVDKVDGGVLTWQNSASSYSLLEPLSSTIQNLSSISDVVGDASSGDVLTFNGSSWAPASIVFPSSTVANLSSVSDVVGDASAGDILQYDGSAWMPAQINFPSSTVANLSSISDVIGDASAGDVLSFDGSSWAPVGIVFPSSTINNISSVGDVIGDASAGDVLVFNGSSWAPIPLAYPSATVENLSSISDVQGDALFGQVLTFKGSGGWQPSEPTPAVLTTVPDIDGRNSVAEGIRYEGLIVFVISEGKNYQLVGGIGNEHWTDIGCDECEKSLGNPDQDDYILSSKTDGTRSWIEKTVDVDEKVKIDGDDLAAGYLLEKLVAGTGISVSKGTGDGEGTLIVANTDKGSSVDLTGYVPYTGANQNVDLNTRNITSTGKIAIGEIDWTGGNIIYVPVGSSINSYISDAVSGDILLLGAGTYTSSAAIAVNKSIAIIGQGESTIINISHASGVFVTTSDVILSNFVVNNSATATVFAVQVGSDSANRTNVHLKDLQLNITGNPSNSYGLRYGNTSGTIKNVKIRTTATTTSTYGMVLASYSRADSTSTIIVENVDIENTSPDATTAVGIYVLDSNSTEDIFVYVYNSRIRTAGATAGTAFWVASADAFGYIYNSILNGSYFDARQSTSATCVVTNCVLVNKLTTGTITSNGETTTGGMLINGDIRTNTNTGLKIGTATNQKISFFNATPVTQQGGAVDLATALSNLGLRAASAAFPLTTTGLFTLGSLIVQTNTLVVNRTGYAALVGIGTTTPAEKLHVVGNIKATGTVIGSNLSGTNTGDQDLSLYEVKSAKGQNNGYAGLDSGGKLLTENFPSSIMRYMGTWDADTNTPELEDGTGDGGDLYVVSVAGTVDFGSGDIEFEVGDWCIYNGSIWERSPNGAAVTSVNTQTGSVVLDADDIADDDTSHKFVTSSDITKLSNLSGTNTGDQDLSGLETSLGDPDQDDYILSSKADGTRSWIENTGGGGSSIDSIGITSDGAGNGVSSGEKGRIVLSYNAEILGWAITTKNGEDGSIAYDIKKNGTSLVGVGNKPLLSEESTSTGNVSDWETTSCLKGDIITFEIVSVSDITWCNLSLEIEKG